MTRMLRALLIVAVFITGLAACNPSKGGANEKSANARGASQGPTGATIPSGTRLYVAFDNSSGKARSLPGDHFMATLTDPVVVEGQTILDKGTPIKVRVVDVQASKATGRSSLRLALVSIITSDGVIPIVTRTSTAGVQGVSEPAERESDEMRLSFSLSRPVQIEQSLSLASDR